MEILNGVVAIESALLPDNRECGFAVNPAVAYPEWLSKLGYSGTTTRAQLECARRCLTEYLHRQAKAEKYVKSQGLFPDQEAFLLRHLHLVDYNKVRETPVALFIYIAKDESWALSNFVEGTAIDSNVEYERLRREGKVGL